MEDPWMYQEQANIKGRKRTGEEKGGTTGLGREGEGVLR
jgi:hypothetical protein